MEKVKTKIIIVAKELGELDKKFKNGSDLDVVQKGYAHKLIHAISTENKVLKCEALKRLADLYLHKAKMKKQKAMNFHKACVLYEEVLQHLGCEEEREVLQHRIKYAEKCTKLVYDQDRAKSGTGVFKANLTSSVAETLQDVEGKAKKKGADVMSLIEGFTNAFLNAIVYRDNRLKTESLKSLGDLYLEKGRVGKDEALFNKAAGLYRAALDRCEGSDGRETLKHRIKYAEKVRKDAEKKRKKTTQPETLNAVKISRQRTQETQEEPDSTYQDQLQEGCMALQTGDLGTAEKNFAAALKSVHVKDSDSDQHWKEAEPLCKLSDVYLKRGIQSRDGGDFTKAAALCNAALVRAREDREGIKQFIQEITQSFAKYVLSSKDIGDVEKHKLALKENRDFVKREIKIIEQLADPYSLDYDDPKLTSVERRRAKAIKTLCQNIADSRRMYIAGLVDECMEVMGPPPCKYAMIGLGSQATGLVTPYSDLEFAILVEEETEDNVRYFRNLTHYLHLKVINLGETILPTMGIKSLNNFQSKDPLDNWFYDSVTPRGFAFDGAMPHACKTPLGRGKAAELIHTPREMSKLLKDDLTFHLKKGYHLAGILGNVCLIAGERDLVNAYAALWTDLLQHGVGVIQLLQQALIAIAENVDILAIPTITSRLINVKDDIYRFSSLAISCWALLYGIQPTTIWETIEKMHKNGVISSENAHHLMVLVSISAELRLRTYMNNRGQVENMSALSSMATDSGIDETLRKVFYFSNVKQLMRYYNTALPLKRKFAIDKPQEMPSVLFDNSPELQRQVYDILCDYKTSKTCLEKALEQTRNRIGKNTDHPDISRLLYNLGDTCHNLGDNSKAVTYYEQSLEMNQSIYGKNTTHTDIADSLHGLGNAWMRLGDHRKAMEYFEQSLTMKHSIHGKHTARSDISASYNGLGCACGELGDLRKAISYHEKSLQMRQSIYGEGTEHPEIVESLSNLGIVWNSLGDHRKAVRYHEQSLQMMQSIHGENTAHPDIVPPLSNLGLDWLQLDRRKARCYLRQSVKMLKSIHGDDAVHHNIALALGNLGAALDPGDHKQAISYGEHSLQMYRNIYDENTAHPHIALTLNNLGAAWRNSGDPRKAISYFEQAIQMRRSVYGEDTAHPDIADSLLSLGEAWHDLDDYRKALSYYEQALQMKRFVHGEETAHTDIDKLMRNMCVAWRHLGDHRKAISCFEQALQMMRSIYGEDTAHPDIAELLDGLGCAWNNYGDHRKAITYFEQSLQMRRIIYGENNEHSEIATLLYNLGTAWADLADHRKSINYYEQSLQIWRNIHGEGTAHSDIALSLNGLGGAWGKLGDHRKAVSYCEQSLQMQLAINGEDAANSEIARSLYNLGIFWIYLGDHRKAVSYCEQSLKMSRRIHGEDTAHPDIADSLHNLAVAWRHLGDIRKAQMYLEQASQMKHRCEHPLF
uniref:Protein-PII uridylyltransferase N-terminal domain-containing protein n=1 Tax=Branchiostoma floridae TaxID=7739 RepID=C3ZQ65_BRAFL|eukprot:XP_002589433.1 hypothetical protein BRAFLDRAFT_80170 [Branchiostoma floridae]